jgi:hypothetical protein
MRMTERISQTELARRIERTTRQVRNLTGQGVLTRNDDGTYPWPAAREQWHRFIGSKSNIPGPFYVTPGENCIRVKMLRDTITADEALRLIASLAQAARTVGSLEGPAPAGDTVRQ